jgi:hypothetical protein
MIDQAAHINQVLAMTEAAMQPKPRFNDGLTYAEMLMKKYPQRVLRFLETMSEDELQVKVGRASPEESNAAWHKMMLDDTAKFGCD